jgi:mRNA-degrading endonuclease RelE of RelBE toxin-antitoxin system
LTYQVLIEEEALEFLNSLSEKSQRIVKEQCKTLADDPFPGKRGDKEALHFPGFMKLGRESVMGWNLDLP